MQSETEAENLEECSEKNDKDINVQAGNGHYLI